MLKSYFGEIFRLVFPERCAVCGCSLPENTRFMCPFCAYDMPLTGYWMEHDNPVFRKFAGLVPLRDASSLMFFTHGSRFRNIIHSFKYHGQWRLGYDLGIMLGKRLGDSNLYKDVDTVIPVPLHTLRRLKRGYNQAEYLAGGIAKSLGIPLDTGSVVRKRYNRSQTRTADHNDRWDNVANIFFVKEPQKLTGRHILLVDDVLTTGATLASCAETIVRQCPDCTVSVVTLSASSYELFGKHGGGL